MDKVLGFRRPPIKTQKSKLSFISKVFFLLDIVQVIVVGSIQITMMVIGDYRPVKDGGMGLGRRIYMILFTCCVIYTCLLCLFAIRLQNFLEIAAFVFQNYLFMCYSFIQVYHLHFKKEYSIPVKFKSSHPVIRILVLLNSVYLVAMNVVFTFLAVKLFQEYGWKIYKKVRFNVNLRGAYHMYELVLCLMKMNLLVVAMFAICYNQTVLRNMQSSPLFFVTISAIPIAMILGFFGYFGIRRENKILTVIFILSLVFAMGCFMFTTYKVAKLECSGCESFRTLVDLPREVVIHIMYLATLALIFCLALCIATLKAFRNFGKGLKSHFVSRHTSMITLSLGITRNISDMFRNLPGDVDSNTNYQASSGIHMRQFNQHSSLVPSDIQHDETGSASNNSYIEDDGSSWEKENMSNHKITEDLTLSNKHVVSKSSDEIRENEAINKLNPNNVANEHFTADHQINEMYEDGASSRRLSGILSQFGKSETGSNQPVIAELPRRQSTVPVNRWFNVTKMYNKTLKRFDSFYRTTHRHIRMSYRFRRSKVTKYGDCHIPSFCAESILINNGIVINTARGRKAGMPIVIDIGIDTEADVFTNVITTNDTHLSSTDTHKKENETFKPRTVCYKYSRSELFTVDNIIQEENEDDNDDTFLPT